MTQTTNKYGYRTRVIETSCPGVVARWLEMPDRRSYWDGALVQNGEEVWVLPATPTRQLARETEDSVRWWLSTAAPPST